MDSLLDTIWDQILIFSLKAASLLDLLLTPLDPLGPTAIIFLLALAMVILSSVLCATYTTKRHEQLQEEFEYWYDLRQEATNHAEREKGKAMAKNIDQAKLNRAYYDYFFEGFLKTLVTTWLPILLMLAYVNASYSPEVLARRFGDEILFVVHTDKGKRHLLVFYLRAVVVYPGSPGKIPL